MFQEERLVEILRDLQEHQRISVQDIIDRYGVSRDTARRDLVKLEEQGAILRTRGGAILPTLTKKSIHYKERIQLKSDVKRLIGQRAASLLKDGDYLIMDASTTVQFAAEAMQTRDNVVVTNSIATANILAEKPSVSIYMLGGMLQAQDRYVLGPRSIEMLSDYQVDKLLIGVCGLNAEGIFHATEEESYQLREMLKCADQVIVLADQTKFGLKLFHKVAGLDWIDMIITDRMPHEDILAALRKHEIELFIVQQEQE
ncbi:DeoR/GlpR transcriptional regulator [Brevibacillus fluminis]|uniref:DeoR/GlpR transcriptional regulator n=2 Tax=Brevibacillus fluminis TaxID=511487 RepID=A0A3M8D0K6_9BACL|nr:DeoR/GlpR transcriptional regulator [Brevibacillus fluminis]